MIAATSTTMIAAATMTTAAAMMIAAVTTTAAAKAKPKKTAAKTVAAAARATIRNKFRQNGQAGDERLSPGFFLFFRPLTPPVFYAIIKKIVKPDVKFSVEFCAKGPGIVKFPPEHMTGSGGSSFDIELPFCQGSFFVWKERLHGNKSRRYGCDH